jgi:hypothetical protein
LFVSAEAEVADVLGLLFGACNKVDVVLLAAGSRGPFADWAKGGSGSSSGRSMGGGFSFTTGVKAVVPIEVDGGSGAFAVASRSGSEGSRSEGRAGKVIKPADFLSLGLGIGLGCVLATTEFFEAFPFFLAIVRTSTGVTDKNLRLYTENVSTALLNNERDGSFGEDTDRLLNRLELCHVRKFSSGNENNKQIYLFSF